jgi:CubicO group peptidase (beta-lactamase class C family)
MEYKNLEKSSTLIQQEIDNGVISGAAIRIIHHNETVYQDELGYADLENKKPIQKDSIYRMFSMSKPITSIAAMILYERGILNLLSPVSDYLDGFKNQKVYTKEGLVDTVRPVTIQDLLNMTSGIVYPGELLESERRMAAVFAEGDKQFYGGNPVDTISFCNSIGQVPLAFQPGEQWLYGASADVLGAVIELASGRKFSDFLKEEIFEPLGMVDTGFYVPKEKQSRFAKAYDYKPDDKKLVPYNGGFLCIYDYMTPPAFESGGAGLVSTVEDYSRFALMLANGGIYNGARIIGRKTIEYISNPQLTPRQAVTFNWDSITGYSYGNLMRVLVDPAKAASNGSLGEFGWDGWTGNYFFVDPKEHLVMVYMVQRCAGTNPDLMRRLRSVIYSAL